MAPDCVRVRDYEIRRDSLAFSNSRLLRPENVMKEFNLWWHLVTLEIELLKSS